MGKKVGSSSYKKCHLCPFGTNNNHIFKRHRLRCIRTHKKSNISKSLDNTADSEWESLNISTVSHDTNDITKPTELDTGDITGSLDGDDNDSIADSINSVDQNEIEQDGNSEMFYHALPSPRISRNYKCTECSFTTTKPKIFLSHQIGSHSAAFTIYPCTLCEYASRYKHKMQRHEQYAHKPKSEIDPLITVPEKSDMNIVKKTKKLPAIPKLKVKLSSNGKSFSKVITAKKSIVSATKKTASLKQASECIAPLIPPEGINTYRCRLCIYKGRSRPRVLNHVISMHINAKILKCKLCPYKTNKKIELYLHKNEHMSGKQIFKCTECSYTSYYKPNLDRHLENHGRNFAFKCEYCNFSTETSGALARHVSSHHPEGGEYDFTADDGEEVNDQSLEDGLYPCECGSAHKTGEDLNRHILLKHPERQLNMEADPGLSFEADNDYTDCSGDEVLTDDYEQNSQNMNCKYCSYVAKCPSDYRQHLKIHSLEKRYKCPICFKKYKYTGDLNVHIRRDHNKEPGLLDIQKVSIVPQKKNSPVFYRCPACPYKTNWKSEMERHSHIHGSEDKTYKCNYCNYQTYWRGDITRHLYRKHEDQISKNDDILNHVIFRNELVVPKGKSRYGTLGDSPLSSLNIKKEDLELEHYEDLEPEPELEKEWDTQSTASSNNSKDNSVVFGATNNNGIYHCDHCEFTANAPSKMKAHVATHLNFKQFMCPVCGKRANWKWDIQKHMKKDHPSNVVPVVKLSEQEAMDTIGNYLATMPAVRRSHHLPSPTKSPVTPKVTLNIPVVRRPSPSELPHQKCSSASKSPIAAGKKPYQCSLCGLRSNFRWSISKHLKTIHEGVIDGSVIVYKVNELATSSESKPVIPHNMENKTQSSTKLLTDDSKKVYMCVICEKKCILKGDIKKHYKYMHPGKEVLIKYLVTGQEFLYDAPDHGHHVSDKTPSDISLDSSPSSSMDNSQNMSTASASSMDNSLNIDNVSSSVVGKGDPSINYTLMGNQTSTHNDPKKHGYVKPFKCSICGHRSNWKWDSKRHLRDKHRGENGYIIVMSIENATTTYSEECLVPNSPDKKQQSSVASVATIVNDDRQRLKRLKCSACDYRSNWRTDIIRHGKKRHPNTDQYAVLLDENVARQTLDTYSYNYHRTREYGNKGSQEAISKTQQAPKRSVSALKPQQRVWRCPKCAFCGVGNSEIIKHMQKHNMKPFKCLVCDFATNFRGALYRHVRKIHQERDHTTCTRINIQYGNTNENGTEIEDSKSEPFREAYVDIFLCKICNFQTSFKYLCCRHLREKHNCTDYSNVLKIRKRQKIKVKSVTKDDTTPTKEADKDKDKRYMCSICPYKAFKHGLLNFHMTYHEPQPGNKHKCKFCPYYVSAPRLLQQHMKLHSKDQGWYSKNIQRISPIKSDQSSGMNVDDDCLPRKHICEKCPYTTNSKNDFIYHKQFHRLKPSAEFKCEFCDYWVTHKRLLKQHMKLHTDAMKLNLYGSLQGSPCKSECESSVIFDTVEIASIKQKIISSKITASLSSSPAVSPMKIATKCGVGSRPGYLLKSGVYRKLHRCKKCPYFNVRTRNLQLHEMMHGYRSSPHPLLKCPHCDYHVGARGLLSHHLKVHQPNYSPDHQDPTISNLEKEEGLIYDDEGDRSSDTGEILTDHKVDTLLEIARFKKFCCEKCPYATAKRFQFQRHCELHGSKQRHTCDFCDYSVPSNNLLLQHRKIHLMPNQNLLAAQSLTNLQHLTEVPADVALASALPPVDMKEPVIISVIHDHLNLYENMEQLEQKKLYRCDRCPYANVRRDHLLTHLKFHVIKSELNCPYCDYSVQKQNFLTQHIKVHFCPLPELSDWLVQNGQAKRAKEMKDQDISEAVELAQKCQKGPPPNWTATSNTEINVPQQNEQNVLSTEERLEVGVDGKSHESTEDKKVMGPPPPPKPKMSSTTNWSTTTSANTYICQYCDREFLESENLLRHEMQHLIGNHFEAFLKTYS